MKQSNRLTSLTLGLALALLFFVQSTTAHPMLIGRYLSVPLQPLRMQQHLLQQTIQLVFPQTITTNRQAFHFMLHFSGYHL